MNRKDFIKYYGMTPEELGIKEKEEQLEIKLVEVTPKDNAALRDVLKDRVAKENKPLSTDELELLEKTLKDVLKEFEQFSLTYGKTVSGRLSSAQPNISNTPGTATNFVISDDEYLQLDF